MVLSPGGEEPTSIRSGVRVRLTARERAVLTASGSGLVVIGVADALGLSPEAVRATLTSAIAKLGARDIP